MLAYPGLSAINGLPHDKLSMRVTLFDNLVYVLLVAVLFFLPFHTLVPSVPLMVVLPVKESLSILMMIQLLIPVCWSIKLLVIRSFKKLNPTYIVIFFFLAWCALSIAWSVNVGLSKIGIVRLTLAIFLGYVIWDTVKREWQISFLMLALTVGSCVACFSILFNFYHHVGGFKTGGWLRYTVTGNNPNNIAFFLVAGLLFAYRNLRLSHSSLLKGFYIFYGFLASYCLFLTGSRSGLIALGVILIYMVVQSFKEKRYRTFAVLLMVFSLILFNPYLPINAHMAGYITSGEILDIHYLLTVSGRQQIWEAAIKIIPNYFIVGSGFSTFSSVIASVHNGHSINAHDVLLQLIVETGIVGLVLYLCFWVMILCQLLKEKNSQKAFYLILFATLWLFLLIHNYIFEQVTWIIISLYLTQTTLNRELNQHEEIAS